VPAALQYILKTSHSVIAACGYTWEYIHIAVKSNDACILGNIMPKLTRLAESVMSPSLLAFSDEL